MSTQDLALRLATLKALSSAIDAEWETAKSDLLAEHGRGTVYAALDGVEVGTASVTKGRAGTWHVSDDRAFLAWVKTHRPSAIIEAVRASDQADILKRITSTGEIPDGVEQGQDGSPYVSVKQTPEQTRAVVQAWRSGALAGILAIGGPQ